MTDKIMLRQLHTWSWPVNHTVFEISSKQYYTSLASDDGSLSSIEHCFLRGYEGRRDELNVRVHLLSSIQAFVASLRQQG